MNAKEIAEQHFKRWHLNDDKKTVFRAYLDLLAKQEGMVPVEQVCPVCAGGPVIVLAECRDCATEFVSPEMSRYNKTAIAKAKDK